jgi:ribose 5-phosphate isomerase B
LEAGEVTDVARETIPIATDHAGFALKQKLAKELERMGYAVQDLGAENDLPSDYPDFAHALAKEISTGEAKRGVLLCGSGIGVDMVANRYRHVRAALAWKPEIAELSRRHNDSNVLVIPARFVTDEEAVDMMKRFLETPFEGGRHARRVDKIDAER